MSASFLAAHLLWPASSEAGIWLPKVKKTPASEEAGYSGPGQY